VGGRVAVGHEAGSVHRTRIKPILAIGMAIDLVVLWVVFIANSTPAQLPAESAAGEGGFEPPIT
jgi:hypothetical protein